MTRAVTARINLNALINNLQRVRQAAPHSKILAVIKANAYGHGLLPVAAALEEADGFGVVQLDEALALRESGFRHPILLLAGCFLAPEYRVVSEHDVSVAIHHGDQVAMLESVASQLPAPIRVWLKIDSGMHRLGVRPADVARLHQRLVALPCVAKPVNFMTHFACADEPGNPLTKQQLDAFGAAIAGHGDGERSLANSAGVLAWAASHYDWVRPGIMLYGVSPFPGQYGSDHQLQPVMTLESRVLVVNHYRKGESLGYGASWTCPEDMAVALVAAGYGDGYPRQARPGTPVLIGGRRAPLVGRVSMDSIFVDLRGLPAVSTGDPVILWGEGLPTEDVARDSGTIGYELTCKLTTRVHYRYVR